MKWTAAAAAVIEAALGAAASAGAGTGREYIVYFMLIFTRIQNDFPIIEKCCSFAVLMYRLYIKGLNKIVVIKNSMAHISDSVAAFVFEYSWGNASATDRAPPIPKWVAAFRVAETLL